MRAALLLTSALALGVAGPASGQGMQGMPGMDHSSMPVMAKPASKPKPKAKPVARPRVSTTRPATATRKPAVVRRERAQNRAPESPAKSATAPVGGNDTGGMLGMPGMSGSSTTGMSGAAGEPSQGGMSGMDHSSMPGMPGMAGTPDKPTQDGMAGLDMSGAPAAGDPNCPAEHAKMGHCKPTPAASGTMPAVGTSLPAGSAPAPAPPMDHYADRIYPPTEMARAREEMRRDQGAQKFAYLAFNLAEVQPRRGGDAFRWDGEGFYGGDLNRVWVKTEGEGTFGANGARGGVETAEVQVLYSRAIDPYFNLQGGVRQDLGRGPRRTYATIGFEGLAPYWFEVEGALFLSDKGDVLGRLEGYYDQRITQRLILQPRAEFNFAAQDVPANGIGAGLSSAELGLRLRYEIRRQFAPYVGVSWERKVGATARLARAVGEDPTSAGIVAGIRFWF